MIQTTDSNGWRPLPSLRWAVPPGTTTQPPRLQQVWMCLNTFTQEWRDVPTEIVEPQKTAKDSP